MTDKRLLDSSSVFVILHDRIHCLYLFMYCTGHLIYVARSLRIVFSSSYNIRYSAGKRQGPAHSFMNLDIEEKNDTACN